MKISFILISAILLLLGSCASAQENHINPYVDTLGLARYPSTHPDVLDAIADSTIGNPMGEKSKEILVSLILNPNSSGKTLHKILVYSLDQMVIDQDLILTLVSHKHILKESLEKTLEFAFNKKELSTLYSFCQIKLKEGE